MVKWAAAGALLFALFTPAGAFAQDAPPAIAPPRDRSNDMTIGVGMHGDSADHKFAGVRATGAINLSERFAIIGEVQWVTAYAERTSSGRIIRDDETTVLTGVRLRRFVDSPNVPYLHLAAGYAARRDNALQIRRSLFAFRSEVGLELSLNDHFAVRAGGGWTFLFVDAPYRHNLGGTIGVTLSLGKR